MPKIEQSRIDTIKQNISLLNWIENDGHEPKKEGADYVMHCVFHADKTPSLKITPHKNLYHCFGCGAAGSIIDWVMNTQGMDFRTAVETIEQQSRVLPSTVKQPLREAFSFTAPLHPATPALVHPCTSAANLVSDDQQTAINSIIEYYHQSLKTNKQALAYLDSRGLNDADLINTFKLGHSDKTLSSSLAAKHTQAGKQQRQLLRDAGILKPSGYEHFAGCLLVPVFDQDNGVELYGRKIQPYAEPKHLYLPGSHAGVWNAAGLQNTDTLILCEALIDAMTFWVHGFKNVTASYGTGGFTEDHLSLIKQNNITNVLIAYDRDKGGNGAATQLAKKLKEQDINGYRINFPKNMDANEYALQVTPARKSLALVIEKAQPMLDAPIIERNKNATIQVQNASPESLSLATSHSKSENKSPLTITETDLTLSCGNRSYRVRGLQNNPRLDQLKINLLTKLNQDSHYVDHLDLYQAKARKHYIASAAEELAIEPAIIKKDLGKLLLALEDHQAQQLNGQTNIDKDKQADLNPDQKKQAMDLLTDKNLIERIVCDIKTTGIIGEDSNALVSYLACVSRKLDKPLAIMIQSTSAAGKSALMDSVLSLMPDNHQHKFAAMTGQSLYYMGELDLKHSILAISEEEGAHNASYALKLLQSEGEVSIASTGKNELTGDLETKTYQVEGPVMLMMTTTAIDIDEELMNRCLVLSVNESREQTQAIHAMQRKKRTLDGLKQKVKTTQLIEQHHGAQTLLKPLAVINPYAEHLTFLSDKTRTRRDHEKYLTLIDSIALLHQYQRQTQQIIEGENVTEYIEVTLEDIEIANQLAHDVLGRSLDELPPQTRKLLNLISDQVDASCKKDKMEQADYRFSRKQIREKTGWGNTQIRIHCDRLVDMEYLLVHRGQRGTSFEYELLYQQEQMQNNKALMKLIDVEKLKTLHAKKSSRGKSSGSRRDSPKLAGPKRPQNGAKTGAKRRSKNPAKPATTKVTDKNNQKCTERHIKTEKNPLQKTATSQTSLL